MSSRAAYVRLARHFAQSYGLNPDVFVRQINQESGFNPGARSGAGALGIAQFEPGTARSVGVNPLNPVQSLRGAAKLMASYVHKYGSYANALVAYNAGPGAVGSKHLPAETIDYVRTILNGKNPSIAGVSGGGSPAIPGTPVINTTGPQQPILLSPQTPPQPLQTAGLPTPAFSALNDLKLPTGYQQVQSGGGAAPAPVTVQDQLKQIAQAGPSSGPSVSVVGGRPAVPGAVGGGGAPMASGLYPLGKKGKIIGTPFQGTHGKAFNVQGGSDNWQSENAVDIAIPVGTPVYAVENGTLGNTGSLGQGGRFAGLRTNLIGKGNSYYYAHLSKLARGIHAGAHVRKGQLLGYSGAANGVAHLHFAAQRGDPRRALR